VCRELQAIDVVERDRHEAEEAAARA